MKTEIVRSLTETFEGHAQQTDGGVEYWLARDVQHLLVYTKWENFLNVVSKAKTACEVSRHDIANHFPDVRKMVDLGSGSQHEIEDIRTMSPDAGAYWRKLKMRLNTEGDQLVTFCHGLKLQAPDGKQRETDCANTEGLFRISVRGVADGKEYPS